MDKKYNRKPIAGMSEKERHLLTSLLQQGRQTVRASDLMEQFGSKKKAANLALSRLARKGWLQRLLPGVYGFVPLSADSANPMPEDAWALSMELFGPCYITGWTAAEQWDLTEQVFNSIALRSAHRFRSKTIEAGGVRYYVQFAKKDEFFGVQKIWRNNVQVSIADPHRTIIDILNDPALGAGGRQTMEIVRNYWKSKHANPDRLFEYAEKIGNGVIFKRLAFTAQKFGRVTDEWLEKCAARITKGVSKFDPEGSDQGSIVSRWNIKINVPIEELP